MDYQKLRITKEDGKEARNRYYDGLRKLLDARIEDARQARGGFMPPKALAEKREAYREQYIQMLGWPLTEYRQGSGCPFQKELLEETAELKIYRLSLETLPGLWQQGILYEPVERAPKSPLIINHPGGGYCVEDLIAHGDYDCGQYKNIGGRFLEAGITMYAPQNLIWNDPERGIVNPQERNNFDVQLKAVGGSMMALEAYHTRCAIDYFLQNEPIDPEKIGMMGLSYGGFYTLYLSAAEPRVKCAFVSCSLFDRYKDPASRCRPDLYWKNSAYSFGEAEVAALIAPRALYFENGVEDEAYPYDRAREEFRRIVPYYEAAGAADRLLLHKSAGGHEIADGDAGFAFFLNHLTK